MSDSAVSSRPAPSPIPQSMVPRLFGENYVLVDEIGHGGMATVYAALRGSAEMQRLCAVKTVRYQHGETTYELLTNRFLEEAATVTRLNHDNLVFVFDAGIVNRDLYLAMEYIEGQSLSAIIDRCDQRQMKFPLGMAMHVVHELLSGLSYAHNFDGGKILHRDVSPSNIMASYSGAVKLIDFGLAKSLQGGSRATLSSLALGKSAYMAPEQYWGQGVDDKADVYSLAVVFWELLAGRRLWGSAERPKLAVPHVPPSQFNPDVPQELDRLLQIALADDPADRFTADELAHAVRRYLPDSNLRNRLAEFMRDLFAVEQGAEKARQATWFAKGKTLGVAALKAGAAGPATGPTSLLGTVLDGRYEVRRLIATGSMGWVYEGLHQGIGRKVAIKVPSWSGDAELLARFVREGATVNRINHPNVVDVTDAGRTPSGGAFLVMEYLEGTPLEQLISSPKKLSPERALRIAIEVAKAMEAAHAVSVVHRDLKPANIMLVPSDEGGEDRVKVLDFGVAKLLHAADRSEHDRDLTRPHMLLGTPAYMAPEQIQAGDDPIDGRADLYALGAILYEMLTGQLPFDDEDPESLCRRKLSESPTNIRDLLPQMDAALASLVMKTLSRNVGERPSHATQIRVELERSLAALAQKRAPMAEPRGKRSMMRWYLLAGFVTCVAILFFALRGPSRVPVASEAGVKIAPEVVKTPSPQPPPKQPEVVPEVQVPAEPLVVEVLPKARIPSAPPAATTEPALSRPQAPNNVAAKPIEPVVEANPKQEVPPEPAQESVNEANAALKEGNDAYRRGRFVEALFQGRKAARLGAGSPAFLLIGRAALSMDEYEDAMQAVSAGLILAPGDPDLERMRMAIKEKSGR